MHKLILPSSYGDNVLFGLRARSRYFVKMSARTTPLEMAFVLLLYFPYQRHIVLRVLMRSWYDLQPPPQH